MSNKARRRKKPAAGEPFSRVRERAAEEQAVMSQNKQRQIRTLIDQHVGKAAELGQEAIDNIELEEYGEAGRLYREASNYLHLANAEKRKLPDAL